MHWRLKALIQRCVAGLPGPAANVLYYGMQRYFGGLRASGVDPTSRLWIGFELCRQIEAQGRSPRGATFFEVGTGWRLNVPIACWLCGADRIVTVDLNCLLDEAILNEDLLFIRRNELALFDRLRSEFGNLIQADRWQRLVQIAAARRRAAELCSLLNIEYRAPADAARTGCRTHSVDYHISCNVLEHIPETSLLNIFREAQRITRPDGLLLHRVDHTDHFSHSDRALSPIHFLRYSDSQWNRYAGNRYSYVNRMREDDYMRVFGRCGLRTCCVHSSPDEGVARQLQDGFPLDKQFGKKSTDILSRLTSLFVTSPTAEQQGAVQAA
jgi:SAM-dependent methyltransferase